MGTAPAGSLRTVVVRDFDLPCAIGVAAAERARPQTVRINVELVVDASGPVRDEDLTSVVDYSCLVRRLRDAVAGPPVRLVETLAERLAGTCWFDHRIRIVRLRVEKLDIYRDIAGIGIAIERRAPPP